MEGPRLGSKTVDPGSVAVSVNIVNTHPPFRRTGGRCLSRSAQIDRVSPAGRDPSTGPHRYSTVGDPELLNSVLRVR
jgi:hypothetical protein